MKCLNGPVKFLSLGLWERTYQMTRKKSFQTAPSVLVLKVMNMDGVKIILIKYLKFKQVLNL